MERIFRTGTALALAGALAIMGTHGAMAQANCDVYGKLAVKQSQEAAQKKCGFTGPRWSLDLAAHNAWCKSVGPTEWRSELKTRAQELKKCSSG
jgi:hypothetical protein